MKILRTNLLTVALFMATSNVTAQVLGGGAAAGDEGIAIDGTVEGNVVTGTSVDCSQDLRDAMVENSTISIHVADCAGPDRLNLQYFWLDLDTAAIVMSSTIPRELTDLFGTEPFVRPTEVWDEATKVLSDFGTLWRPRQDLEDPDEPRQVMPAGLSLTLLARSEARRMNFSSLVESLVEAGADNPFVRYLSMEPFPWPDLETVERFTSGTTWPDASYTYAWRDSIGELRQALVDDQDFFPAADAALSCVVPFRFLGESEFGRYWEVLDEASTALETGEISGFRFLPGAPFEGESAYWRLDTQTNEPVVRPIRAGHPSYDAVAHFGRHNWPSDYLLAAGSHYGPNGCWGTPGGFTLTVLPRKPFVLFAVLSPQDEEVTVTRLHLRRDPGPELRREVQYADAPDLRLASQLRLTRDRPMLVPLRIDLRYDLGDEPFGAITGTTNSAEEIRQTLKRLAPDPLGIDYSPHWRMTRSMSNLPPPTVSPITRRYIYGPSLAIASVETDTTTYLVAEPPAAALISGRWVQGGSCPFVSFFDKNGVRLHRHRILVGASAPDLAMLEEVIVPEGTQLIRIEEIEPEISYLSRIALHGPEGEQVIVEDQALRPGEGLEIRLPEGVQRFSVKGFYELL